ncbi:conserved hypothetical protein [uncultured Desulfobacterium sp.]|uniref:Uncharacterized protein n=1 Tax=uncultured Desulfobacterium sp. TaxID=201089 RepID=A0A445MTL9_9BACT|nr:conserved hypothetical protein [uncultured Desulfobacterium sp.]
MNATLKTIPTEKSKMILKILMDAVAETLEKKRRLGQYAVMWDGKKPVQKGADAPTPKD